MFLRGNHQRARAFGLRLRFGFGLGHFGDRNNPVLLFNLQRPAALDVKLRRLLLAQDALSLDRANLVDTGFFNLLGRADLHLFGVALALGSLTRNLGFLLGATGRHFALLLQARVLAFAVDAEGELFGLEVLFADRNHRVLLDVIALFLAGLDLFSQAGQALRVKGIGRVEHLHIRLVQAGQRRGLQLQSVVSQ